MFRFGLQTLAVRFHVLAVVAMSNNCLQGVMPCDFVDTSWHQSF